MRKELLEILSDEQKLILNKYNMLSKIEKLIFEENLINCEYADYVTIFKNSKIVGISDVNGSLTLNPIYFDKEDFDCIMIIMNVKENITYKEIDDVLYKLRTQYDYIDICIGAYISEEVAMSCVFIKY